jgi:hypothetical protein
MGLKMSEREEPFTGIVARVDSTDDPNTLVFWLRTDAHGNNLHVQRAGARPEERIAVGDEVDVFGSIDAEGNLVATRIAHRGGDPIPPPPRPRNTLGPLAAILGVAVVLVLAVSYLRPPPGNGPPRPITPTDTSSFSSQEPDANKSTQYPSAELEGERFPQTRTRRLTTDEVAKWSSEDLRYAINELNARHGYDFENPEVRQLFARRDWYHRVSGRKSVESDLNAAERANYEFMVRVRNQRKGER